MNDMILLKANILKEMNEYVLSNCESDEDAGLWFEVGVPDGADDEMLIEIASDDDLFRGICIWFGQIIKEWTWGE